MGLFVFFQKERELNVLGWAFLESPPSPPYQINSMKLSVLTFPTILQESPLWGAVVMWLWFSNGESSGPFPPYLSMVAMRLGGISGQAEGALVPPPPSSLS